MENTKKILKLISCILILSCHGSSHPKYYNREGEQIAAKDIYITKFNLYKYKGNIVLGSPYVIVSSNNDEKLLKKENGILLQDSIFSEKKVCITTLIKLLILVHIQK